MTLNELIESSKKLGLKVQYNDPRTDSVNYFRIYYDTYRLVEILSKKGKFVVHGHWWKIQDQAINTITVEEWEDKMRKAISGIKQVLANIKLHKIKEDFV